LKLSEVGQWSFEHLEEEAKIEEARLATSEDQVTIKNLEEYYMLCTKWTKAAH
jgi:hypothetical protein